MSWMPGILSEVGIYSKIPPHAAPLPTALLIGQVPASRPAHNIAKVSFLLFCPACSLLNLLRRPNQFARLANYQLVDSIRPRSILHLSQTVVSPINEPTSMSRITFHFEGYLPAAS